MTTKTELLNNGVLVATKTAAPFYSWDWTPATSGASSLTYKRYEDGVLVFTSAAITGTVDAASTSYDVTYQAKLDDAVTKGIPLPTTAQSDIYNQRLIDFKAAGGFAKSDVVMDWSGTADIAFKLLDIKRLVSATVVGAITNNSTGLVGAGGIVNMNFVLSNGVNYTFGNAGIFTILNTNPVGVFATYGVIGSNNRQTSLLGNRTGTNYYGVNTLDGDGGNENKYQKTGANGHYRENGTEVIYKTDVTNTLSIASNAEAPNLSIHFFGENFKGTPRTFSTVEIGFVAIGASYSAEHNAIKTALTI